MVEPIRLIATGVGATHDPETGSVTMNLDTTQGPVHIDLTEEFAEALGLLLLDDPEHSDGYVETEVEHLRAQLKDAVVTIEAALDLDEQADRAALLGSCADEAAAQGWGDADG